MQNEHELAELIIRNVTDIEHAMQFLEEYVTPRLAESIFDILEHGVRSARLYCADRNDPGGWFCPEHWLLPGSKKENADVWFQIDTPDDDPWESWVAQFCGGAPTVNTSALLVRYNGARIGKRRWLELRNRMPEKMEMLSKAGFVIEGDQIYYPLPIDRERLAVAAGKGAIADALVKITEAAEALDNAMPAFEALFQAQSQLTD